MFDLKTVCQALFIGLPWSKKKMSISDERKKRVKAVLQQKVKLFLGINKPYVSLSVGVNICSNT